MDAVLLQHSILQRPLQDRKASLFTEMTLIEAEQIRRVGRRLGSKGVQVCLLEQKSGVPHQLQAQTIRVLAPSEKAEEAVDPFRLHPLRAERPEAEARHGRVE